MSELNLLSPSKSFTSKFFANFTADTYFQCLDMPRSRVPTVVADFIALPVIFQSTVLKKDVKHYLYIKAYEPKIPDEESIRALFIVNIPVTTNEAQLRHLFTTQLGGGHVQNVYFANQDGSVVSTTSSSALIATTKPATNATSTALGKRKRQSAQETPEGIAQRLSNIRLPSTHPSQFHQTGSTAIAIFLDRPARDLTLRACRKAAKASASKPLIWSDGLSASKLPPLGTSRYSAQRALTFPPRAQLLKLVDEYMTTYAELESAQSQESAKRRAEPDEDGFVTVTRGSKGVIKTDEAEAIKAKLEDKKRKSGGLEDFYRFQMRERRKQEQGKLLSRFEEEKKLVREMGERRAILNPEQ